MIQSSFLSKPCLLYAYIVTLFVNYVKRFFASIIKYLSQTTSIIPLKTLQNIFLVYLYVSKIAMLKNDCTAFEDMF
jgi:hypothetical protein